VFDFFGKGISKEDAKLMDANANQKAGSLIKRQNAFFEKSRGRVLIEETEKYALIYLPLGNKANEFIARMISYILSATGNQGITARATPYLITLDYSESRKSPNLERIMDSLKTIDIAVQKRNFVINSELFRYKFLQVAKLFGIVEKKAKMTRSNSLKLVDFYKDSVVAEETLRDLEKNYFDIKVVEKFLSNMRNAGIEVAVIRGFVSPLGEEILRANYNYREFLLSTAPAEEELKEFERHAIGETAELLCTYCGFEFSKKIENYDEGKISCHSCKSPMVCMFTEDRKEIIEKRLAGKKLSEKEQEAYENMVKETGLVEAYGNRALIALSTYGIGLVSAARALRMLRRNKLQFYTDLIEAQKNFIRTKKFWKK
jgi:ATP-dependent Lhr-like helicase